MTDIRLLHTIDVPIYKQIVTQLRLMIEAGQLVDGDRLPSSRLLATNLRINRNTVAKAYAELRDAGLVESQRRNGMVVRNAGGARQQSLLRESADSIMSKAVEDCFALGLSAEEISELALRWAAQVERAQVRVVFVESNTERAEFFAQELSNRLFVEVRPLILGQFDPTAVEADLVLTTFFHVAQVRRLMRAVAAEVVAIVVAPHVQTLVQLAGIGADKQVGVLYSTDEQDQVIRDSLVQSGLDENVRVLHDTSDSSLKGIDVVVIPSEMPELGEQLDGRVEVVAFMNVLDEASTRMVAAVVDDLREALHSQRPQRAITEIGDARSARLPLTSDGATDLMLSSNT